MNVFEIEGPADTKTLLEGVGRWAALRTGARWEKSVTEQLSRVGVPTYLPLLTRVSKSKSKTQSALVPMFPGYVFCSEGHYLENKQIPLDCRKKIAQLLRTPDPAKLREELLLVAGLLTDRRVVQERFNGVVGDVVRIIGGPLTGSLGEILRLKPGTRRVVLSVSFLGAHVEALVAESLIEMTQPPKDASGSPLRRGA